MKELGSEYFEYLHFQPYLNIYWKYIYTYIYIFGCLHEAGKYLSNLDGAFYITVNLNSRGNK